MNTDRPPSLVDQRDALRRQIHLQRRVIEDHIDPVPEANLGYPRSKIMRFLTQRPGLVTQLVAGVLGGRVVKSVAIALTATRVLRAFRASR